MKSKFIILDFHIARLLVVLLFTFISIHTCFSQEKYILLSDQTGVNREGYKPALEEEATLILNYIEETNTALGEPILPSDLRVYDFGAYVHNPSQYELTEILSLSRGQANNENRIIFNKISDSDGIWSRVLVEVNLNSDLLGCYDNQFFQSELQFEFDAYYNQNSDNFQNACKLALDRYLVLLKRVVCCYIDHEELGLSLDLREMSECSNSAMVEIVDSNVVNFSFWGSNNFISRTGSIITFQDKPQIVGFFQNGTVSRFKVGNKLYRSCGDRETGTIFKGYRINCEEGTNEYIFEKSWEAGDEANVNFGINEPDCKAHLYSLKYISLVNDPLKNGGIDHLNYYDDISISNEVTSEELYYQPGLDEFKLPPNYEHGYYKIIIDYTENGGYPCPDFNNILKQDLAVYSGNNELKIYPDKVGFWQKTTKGWVYYRVNNEGKLDCWVYDPQSHNYLGFEPVGSDWENDGEVMAALYIALNDAMQDVDTYIYIAEGVGLTAGLVGAAPLSIGAGLAASALYLYKGDKNNAILSTLVVAGDIYILVKNSKYVINGIGNIYKVVKGVGNTVEVTHSVSGLSAATIDIVKNYGFKTREAASLFLDDLGSQPFRTFLESAGENGVKAWDALINTGLRTNIKWLETTSKWIDDGLEIIATATKVSIKKAGVEVGEISGDLLKVRYPHYGGDVICHSTKTTTIVGRFEGNISIIKDSQLWKYGENPSGVNILNDPNWTWPINEQWLTSAANRGDIIRVVSDPTNINNIWKNGIVGGEKTNFGLEVDFLDNLGYTFDAMKFQFVH